MAFKKRTHATVASQYFCDGVYIPYVLRVGTEKQCQNFADNLLGDYEFTDPFVVEATKELLDDWDNSGDRMLVYGYEENEDEGEDA